MQISRKECEKFKMAINFDYDFSGWATKANVKCFDGLTIAPNAFKDCDGTQRPQTIPTSGILSLEILSVLPPVRLVKMRLT